MFEASILAGIIIVTVLFAALFRVLDNRHQVRAWRQADAEVRAARERLASRKGRS